LDGDTSAGTTAKRGTGETHEPADLALFSGRSVE
jgi:hypothetical protein